MTRWRLGVITLHSQGRYIFEDQRWETFSRAETGIFQTGFPYRRTPCSGDGMVLSKIHLNVKVTG